MTKLLFIKASPRGAESKSGALASAYLARLQETSPGIETDILDLSQEALPDYDGDKVAAKMNVITGQDQNNPQRSAWDQITSLAQRFIAADIYLIASPMWNGSIPYRLKQYIDLIHQPGLLWGLEPETGYFGLLENKRAVLALTSGAYGPEMPSPAFGVDYQSSYLRFWLNQAGVKNIAELRFQPSLLTQDPEGDFQAAIARAQALAS